MCSKGNPRLLAASAMSDSEGTGERSPKDKQPASKDGPPPPSDEPQGDQPPLSPASPGGGSPSTLTTPQSISLPGELSPSSGDTSSSKSGDKTREGSPTSQGSRSPRSPDSKRRRRSSVSFVKTPTVHPIPPRSRSAPASPPPGCLAAVESAVGHFGAKMKKLVKGKVQAPPLSSWMKEVPTRRYRCDCGRLYSWGEPTSAAGQAGPSKAVPEGKCDKCDNSGPKAPHADPEELAELELEERAVQQPQVSIVVHPPTDEPMLEEPSAAEPEPEDPPAEMPMLEDPQAEEPPSEMPERPPEPPCDEAA